MTKVIMPDVVFCTSYFRIVLYRLFFPIRPIYFVYQLTKDNINNFRIYFNLIPMYTYAFSLVPVVIRHLCCR